MTQSSRIPMILALAIAAPLLVAWGWATDPIVELPRLAAPAAGLLVAAVGVVLIALGIVAPPASARGVRRYLAYPIHVGVVVACIGFFLAVGSPGGLWLVTPAVLAAAIAIAAGSQQAGPEPASGGAGDGPGMQRALIAIAPDDDARPSVWHAAAVFPIVFVPWLLAYKAVTIFGPPAGSIISYLPFEHDWPVLVWTEPVYASPYLIVTLAAFFAATNRDLRRFVIGAVISTAAVIFMFLTVPLIAPPKPFDDDSFLGVMLHYERVMDQFDGTAAFPSFHVIWTCLAAALLSARWPRWAWLIWTWALAVAASCVTTGMHSLVDLFAGFGVFAIVHHYATLAAVLGRAIGPRFLSAVALAFLAVGVARLVIIVTPPTLIAGTLLMGLGLIAVIHLGRTPHAEPAAAQAGPERFTKVRALSPTQWLAFCIALTGAALTAVPG